MQSTAKSWLQLQNDSALKIVFILVMVVSVHVGRGQTYYNMSSGNYSQNFTNISNTTAWPSGFNGTESQMWLGLAVNATGVIPSALRITTATTSFVTGTTGGVQRGVGNIQLLSTGSSDNTTSAGIELYLNFTGQTAGSLTFNAAQVANSTGNRVGTLRVYASIDGTTYTELSGVGTGLPYSATNNVVSSAFVNISLPASFNNAANARLRFYYHNGSGGTTGSRPKISIDDISVTSTTTICSSPTNQASSVVANYTCANSITLGWANGNGTRRIVKINSSNSFTAPTDGDDPTANTVYSGSGEQVVYNNNSNSVNITGLNSNTTYWFRIYEYNCTGLNTKYLNAIASTSLATNSSACNNVGDYQTRASGDWNNSATWQKWDGGNWANCTGTDFPDNGTANVTIRSGHNIDNDGGGAGTQPNPTGAPWDVRNLTVEAGAVLKDYSFVGGNSYIQIYGNIVCNGTIGDPLGDDISFDIAGGANCTITGSGSFTATRIRKDANINPGLNTTLAIDMDIRLTWSSSSGTVLYNDGSTSNFNVTINAGRTVRCSGPGSAWGNVAIDGSNFSSPSTFEAGGSINVNGTLDMDGILFAFTDNSVNPCSILINNGGTLKCRYVRADASGTAGNVLRIFPGGRLNIFGSVDTVGSANQTTWNNFSNTNNTWDFQPGSTLEYSGNTIQSVNGITQCSNFTVSGGAAKILSNPFTVEGILTLTNGLVNTTNTNILTLTSTATCPASGSFSSFVNGPMRKIGGTNFTFPVGKPAEAYTAGFAGGYRPLGISNLSGSETFTTEYILSNPTIWSISDPAKAAGLQSINRCEYWNLTRLGSQRADVTLTWSTNPAGQSQCNVVTAVNTAKLQVVPFYNNQWGDTDNTYFGNSGVTTDPSIAGFSYITWTGDRTTYDINSYLKFVVGSNDAAEAPLPFDIKNFKATGKDKIVQLDWLINHNDEVKSYVIERSRDGLHFEPLKMVVARANEETASYADVDPTPYNGWGYYRLRITDFTGKTGYSVVQKVWMGNAGTYVQVTPKPAKDRLWINLAEPEKVNEMVIVNSVGQLLFKQNRFTSNNQIDISALRPGVYYIRLIGQNGIFTEPFVKE